MRFQPDKLCKLRRGGRRRDLQGFSIAEFPKKKFNLRGARLGKGGITRSSTSDAAGFERTALFNTWLNGVLGLRPLATPMRHFQK